MPFKCCVFNCDSNYDSTSGKVTVFRFPDNADERERWINSLPNDGFQFTVSKRICSKHWPIDYRHRVVKGGAKVPVDPPSIFQVPQSCIPTVSKPRECKNPASVRNQLPDELSTFLERDRLSSVDDAVTFLKSEFQNVGLIISRGSECLILTSEEYNGAVSKFTIVMNIVDPPKGRWLENSLISPLKIHTQPAEDRPTKKMRSENSHPTS